jgi:hypothetical protein
MLRLGLADKDGTADGSALKLGVWEGECMTWGCHIVRTKVPDLD